MKDLLWTPLFSWPLLTLLVVGVLGAVSWSLWRGVRSRRRAIVSGALRVTVLALLAVMLFQPQRRYDEVTVLKPQLAVLVDSSESMSDQVDDAQPKRAERALEWLRSASLMRANEAFEVRLFSFDTQVAEADGRGDALTFSGSGSSVIAAVNQVQERFRGQPLAGVLVLSDGLDTSGLARSADETAPLPLSGGAPVFTFELEKPFQPQQRGRRVSIGSVDYPARVVVGWDSEIRAAIVGSGMNGSTVSVELWRDGRKEREGAVAFNEEEQTRTVAFPLSAEEPGMLEFELRVADTAADAAAQSHPFVIEALAPGKRVLYVQNSLGFDFKFLRKAIVSDRNLQLSAFVRWGDGRIVSMGERGVPAEGKLDFTQAGLARYSVVMLGDLAPDALTPEQFVALKEFVNRGGGLVLLGGPNQLASPAIAETAVADVSPVRLPAEYREGNAPVTITDAGLRHPVFGPLFTNIKEFPPLLTANIASGVSPTAEVLMEVQMGETTAPLIASTKFGQGRVVAVMTDTIWSWRLAATSWSAERSPYDVFWTQLMDWLIPKEQEKQGGAGIELFTERANYLLGERPEVRAIVRTDSENVAPPATLPLSVKTPDGKTFEYTMKTAILPGAGGKQVPGYRVEVEPNVAGVFAARSVATFGGEKAEAETRFVVMKPATELTQKPIDRTLLQRLAEQSGGRFFALEEADQWLKNIRHKEQQFARMQLLDLWNHPVLLTVIFALLAADWACRKVWNLP